jgi:NAD(P)-dependent dehydrogenase (short-subunit alcohol dehydrogenase family)
VIPTSQNFSVTSTEDRRLSGVQVLVTGGTRGIGLAIGLAFARRGCHVALTHKWGSADDDAIRARFAELGEGTPVPQILDADASQDADTTAAIGALERPLDVLVSNVAFAPVVTSVDDYTRRGITTAIEYSTWPVVAYAKAAHERSGRYPRYILALSSAGAETFHVNYDIVAVAKAGLEAMCRYLNHRLRESGGTRVNVLRTRFASTEALRATFGDDFEPFVEARAPGLFTPLHAIGEAAYGMCSGLMDGVGGQVITVDGGAQVSDGFSRLFDDRQRANAKAVTK